ncbi:unnamed protein product [Adineta ricciae]|uniref:NTR domain-containing protein n=1 Tax=Adineta ricciae TaxID=249248 RepID=A0A815EDC0_ADIRI|nr:unnamed protein product [Adineta ricciae]
MTSTFDMYSMLIFIALIGTAFSCSCMALGSIEKEFQKTHAVFIGRILHKTRPDPFKPVEYKMRVEEAFKGVSKGEMILVSAYEQSETCGLGIFNVGDRMQVWLDENFSTNACTRSTRIYTKDTSALRRLAGRHH